MQSIPIISLGIAIFGIVVLIILNVLKITDKESKVSKIITWVLICAPCLVLVISSIYIHTDTWKDFFIISGCFLIFVLSLLFYDKFIDSKKYFSIGLVGIMIMLYILYILVSKYLLNEFNSSMIFGAIGGIMGANAGKSFKKSGVQGVFLVVSVFIIILGTAMYEGELDIHSKPASYAIKYLKDNGYEVSEDDNILQSRSDNTRYKPIDITIINVDTDGYKICKKVKLEYFKESIRLLEE